MPLPAFAYYVLTGLGGWAIGQGLIWNWLKGPEDEWSDADVFNDRMRQIHQGILDLNNLFAKCAPFHDPKQSANLNSWRSYIKLWSQFYQEVGSKTFAPNSPTISDAKNYAETLARWVDVYKGICGDVPTGLKKPVPTQPPKSGTDWTTVFLWATGIAAGGYILGSYLKSKGRPSWMEY